MSHICGDITRKKGASELKPNTRNEYIPKPNITIPGHSGEISGRLRAFTPIRSAHPTQIDRSLVSSHPITVVNCGSSDCRVCDVGLNRLRRMQTSPERV